MGAGGGEGAEAAVGATVSGAEDGGRLERLWWPQRCTARQWWRYGRQHRLQRWFGLDQFLLLMPMNYSRRLLVRCLRKKCED